MTRPSFQRLFPAALIAPFFLLASAHAAGTLIAPWKSADIGKVGVPGSAGIKAGVWTIAAAG